MPEPTVSAWSIVHGFSALVIDGQIDVATRHRVLPGEAARDGGARPVPRTSPAEARSAASGRAAPGLDEATRSAPRAIRRHRRDSEVARHARPAAPDLVAECRVDAGVAGHGLGGLGERITSR